MNLKITKSALLIALAGFTGSVMAQDTLSTQGSRFSKQMFRTWSIGAHAGLNTPRTMFDGMTTDVFSTSHSGYLGKVFQEKLDKLIREYNALYFKKPVTTVWRKNSFAPSRFSITYI